MELSPEILNSVVKAVVYGEWPQRALVRLGVPGEEASRWLSVGAEDAREGVDSMLAELHRAVDIAEADCERDWLEKCKVSAVAGQSQKAFIAWMTLLERRFPERYCVRGNQNRRSSGKAEESFEEALARLQQES